MNKYDESGKEHIQNHLEAGECLGESFLFIDNQYPMNAVAINSCEVLSLKKSLFISLMQENPKMCFEINKNLSKKLYLHLTTMTLFSILLQTNNHITI